MYTKSSEKILDWSFVLLVFCLAASEHTILGQLALLLFVALMIPLMLHKFHFSAYFVIEAVFIVYCVLQNILGITVDTSEAYDKIQTLTVCIVFYIAFYNYIIYKGDIGKVIRGMNFGAAAGLFLTFLVDFDLVLSGRFGSGNNGLTILGIKLGGTNSTYIGQIAGIMLFLAFYIYYAKDKKKAWFWYLFYSAIIMLCGVRKMMLSMVVALFIVPLLYASGSQREKLVKIIQRIVIVAVFAIFAYIAVIKIEVLYNSVGYRLESVMSLLLSGESSDASISTRTFLKELALESIAEKPVFGWGLGNFAAVINNVSTRSAYYTHNNYLEIAVSGGIVGFVIYYVRYIYLGFRSWKVLRRTRSMWSPTRKSIVALLALCTMLLVLEIWQVDYIYRINIMPFIILLACVNLTKNEYAQYKLDSQDTQSET